MEINKKNLLISAGICIAIIGLIIYLSTRVENFKPIEHFTENYVDGQKFLTTDDSGNLDVFNPATDKFTTLSSDKVISSDISTKNMSASGNISSANMSASGNITSNGLTTNALTVNNNLNVVGGITIGGKVFSQANIQNLYNLLNGVPLLIHSQQNTAYCLNDTAGQSYFGSNNCNASDPRQQMVIKFL